MSSQDGEEKTRTLAEFDKPVVPPDSEMLEAALNRLVEEEKCRIISVISEQVVLCQTDGGVKKQYLIITET